MYVSQKWDLESGRLRFGNHRAKFTLRDQGGGGGGWGRGDPPLAWARLEWRLPELKQMAERQLFLYEEVCKK